MILGTITTRTKEDFYRLGKDGKPVNTKNPQLDIILGKDFNYTDIMEHESGTIFITDEIIEEQKYLAIHKNFVASVDPIQGL